MPDPHPPFLIRAATPRDGERVAEMAAALGREEGGIPSRFSAEAFRRDGFGARAAFACLIAERDGAAIGYALHYPDYDTDRMARAMYLADLYVEKTARRRGVGHALMAAVAGAGQRAGARRLGWGVLRRNHPARLFYAGIGRERDEAVVYSLAGERFRRLSARPALPADRTVRPARPADAAAIAAMLTAAKAEAGRPTPDNLLATLRADGFGPEATFACLIAEHNGAPAGYAMTLDAYDTETSARGLYLADLYVLPSARRRGLARALIGATAGAAARADGQFVYWEAGREDGRVRALSRTMADELEDIILCVAEGEDFERLVRQDRRAEG